jgi:anaphase-promoting complex subunit 4
LLSESLGIETTSANPANETAPPLRHDILEVNQYLMQGLEGGTIEKWFSGQVPAFSPQDLGLPSYSLSLEATLQEARKVLTEGSEFGIKTVCLRGRRGRNYLTRNRTYFLLVLQEKGMPKVGRNLCALVDELAANCRQVFDCSTGAATKSARVTSPDRKGTGAGSRNISVRERTIMQVSKLEIRFAERKDEKRAGRGLSATPCNT